MPNLTGFIIQNHLFYDPITFQKYRKGLSKVTQRFESIIQTMLDHDAWSHFTIQFSDHELERMDSITLETSPISTHTLNSQV